MLKSPFKKLKAKLLTAAGLLALSSCAHIQIPVGVSDMQWCHPFGAPYGASCDNLLTSNPQLLDEAHWQALQAAWLTAGSVLECTGSKSMLAMKVLIEDVCSQYPCDEATKTKIVVALEKVSLIGVMGNGF
jgi:hypothetical protein